MTKISKKKEAGKFHSKSEERRAKFSVNEKIEVQAELDTRLPDGTFVQKGDIIKVSKEYFDRLKKERDKSFINKQ